MDIDSPPILITSLALVVGYVSNSRHGFPLTEWVLTPIREPLVTVKV